MLYPKNDVCDHKDLFPKTANLRNVKYVYKLPIPVNENFDALYLYDRENNIRRTSAVTLSPKSRNGVTSEPS